MKTNYPMTVVVALAMTLGLGLSACGKSSGVVLAPNPGADQVLAPAEAQTTTEELQQQLDQFQIELAQKEADNTQSEAVRADLAERIAAAQAAIDEANAREQEALAQKALDDAETEAEKAALEQQLAVAHTAADEASAQAAAAQARADELAQQLADASAAADQENPGDVAVDEADGQASSDNIGRPCILLSGKRVCFSNPIQLKPRTLSLAADASLGEAPDAENLCDNLEFARGHLFMCSGAQSINVVENVNRRQLVRHRQLPWSPLNP
jgi:multidrug efflux pump subunit AcrA (membrane-fusion protein)